MKDDNKCFSCCVLLIYTTWIILREHLHSAVMLSHQSHLPLILFHQPTGRSFKCSCILDKLGKAGPVSEPL